MEQAQQEDIEDHQHQVVRIGKTFPPLLIHFLDSLQEHGVNVSDIKKLRGAGIFTVEGLLMSKEVLIF